MLGGIGLAVLAFWSVPAPTLAQEAASTFQGNSPSPPAPQLASMTDAPTPSSPEAGLLGGAVFVRAEYLLMQPRRRALDFAIVDPNQDGKPEGSIESLTWQSDSGLRVGGGYRLTEGWELGAYYTYLYSKTNQSLAAPNGGTLYATLTHPGFVDAVDTATANSSFKYNVLDVEIGRRFPVGDSLCVWLGTGGRFAWIDQKLSVVYNGQSAFQDQVTSPIYFDGAGVRVGGEGQWTITHGFGLYSKAYGSLLAGDFRTSLRETNNAGSSVITDVSDRFEKVVPVVEFGIGIAWQNEWVRARLGYEISDWIGLVDSPDFVHDYTNKLSHRTGDVSLDGLTFEVELTF
jgi:hypothetical protein